MSRSSWALLAFLAIGGFFLLTEHRAHVLGALPFLLLLACPLLHLFHHGSHGSGRHCEPAENRRDHGEPHEVQTKAKP